MLTTKSYFRLSVQLILLLDTGGENGVHILIVVEKVIYALELLFDDLGVLHVFVALEVSERDASHVLALRVILHLLEEDPVFDARVQHVALPVRKRPIVHEFASYFLGVDAANVAWCILAFLELLLGLLLLFFLATQFTHFLQVLSCLSV